MRRSQRLLKCDLRALTAVNRLPIEIVRYIIRLATEVPVAFDTRYEFVLEEDRIQTRRLILASLQTKLAVTLVSKSFAILTEEFLYEIVLITRYPTAAGLKRLATLLQDQRGRSLKPRGERVRRLELHFHLRMKTNKAKSWDTLWGLLPACPNLEALYVSPQGPFNHGRSVGTSTNSHTQYCVQERSTPVVKDEELFNLSEDFARAIIQFCGRTLRRLHLGAWVYLPILAIIPMLSGLSAIEVVYAGSAYDQRWVWRLLPECILECYTRRGVSLGWGLPQKEDWKSKLPKTGRFKHLHTLLLPQAPWKAVDCPRLPSLAHVAVDQLALFPDQLNLMQPNTTSITSLYFHTDGHLNADKLRLCVELLPNLQQLWMVDVRCWAGWPILCTSAPHAELRTITLFRKHDHHKEDTLITKIQGLLLQVRDGKLPALSRIRIGGQDNGHYPRKSQLISAKTLRPLGIRLEDRPDLTPYYESR